MKSQQIKLAYGLGLLNALTHNGVSPSEFVKQAEDSLDPQVRKIAHAAAYTIKQLNKASNIKTANADPGFRQFRSVFAAAAPNIRIEDFRGHVKTAASQDARSNGTYVGACAQAENTSDVLFGYKLAEDMMEEEGGETDDAEMDPGYEEEGGEMDDAEGGEMAPDDVVAQLQSLVDSGEMSEEELAAIMDELTAGADSVDPVMEG